MDPEDSIAFAEYVQSVVRLKELEKMTDDLNEELISSQKIMKEIKTIFESAPAPENQIGANRALRHEGISNFLEASGPQLLMEGMEASSFEGGIDNVIAEMKGYAEELKKKFSESKPAKDGTSDGYQVWDLEQYASSLDQLCKRLTNIKLTKDNSNKQNEGLETKLAMLCQDVNMFTQMVQATTKVNQSHSTSSMGVNKSDTLHYDNLINKLLFGINEVNYLLQNKDTN